MDKQLPLFDVRTGNHILSLGVTEQRFQMLLLGSFAAIGLLLTGIGLYVVLSYAVVSRTREIGVRMALGASRSVVFGLVMGKAFMLVAAGVVIGMSGSFASNQFIRTMIYGIDPWNPGLLAARYGSLSRPRSSQPTSRPGGPPRSIQF